MKKFNSLFWTGFTVIMLPAGGILIMVMLSFMSPKMNVDQIPIETVYDTVKVEKKVLVYDTVKIVKEVKRKNTDTLRVVKDTIK